MGKNPFRGPLEGVGPENRDFFGPKGSTLLLSFLLDGLTRSGSILLLLSFFLDGLTRSTSTILLSFSDGWTRF
jgi:hypothetical protein